jgi:hypothetical protein
LEKSITHRERCIIHLTGSPGYVTHVLYSICSGEVPSKPLFIIYFQYCKFLLSSKYLQTCHFSQHYTYCHRLLYALLPAFLRACLVVGLPALLPVFLSACTHLPVGLLLFCQYARLPACLPTARTPTCLCPLFC